jgi:hypothetical protein
MVPPQFARRHRNSDPVLNNDPNVPNQTTPPPTAILRPTLPNTPPHSLPILSQEGHSGNERESHIQERRGSAETTNAQGSRIPLPLQLRDDNEGMLVSPGEEAGRLIHRHPSLHSYIEEREKVILDNEFRAHQLLQNLNCKQHMEIQALRQAAKNNTSSEDQPQNTTNLRQRHEGKEAGSDELQWIKDRHNESIKSLKTELNEKDTALKAKKEEILALKAEKKKSAEAQAAFASQDGALNVTLEKARTVNERQQQELVTAQTQSAALQAALNEASTMNGRQQQELQVAETQSRTFQATLSEANTAKEIAEQALLTASEQIKTLQAKLDNANSIKEHEKQQLVTEHVKKFNEQKKKMGILEQTLEDTKIQLESKQELVSNQESAIVKLALKIVEETSNLENVRIQLQESNDKLQKSENEFEEVKIQLQQTNEKLQKCEIKLEGTKAQLEKSDSKLHKCDNKLKETRAQLEKSDSKLHKCDNKLKETKAQLEKSDSNLHKCDNKLKGTKIQLQEAKGTAIRYSNQIIESQKQWKTSTAKQLAALEKRYSEQRKTDRITVDEKKKEIEGLKAELKQEMEKLSRLDELYLKRIASYEDIVKKWRYVKDRWETEVENCDKLKRATKELEVNLEFYRLRAERSSQNNASSKKRKADPEEENEKEVSDPEADDTPSINRSSLRQHPKKKVR